MQVLKTLILLMGILSSALPALADTLLIVQSVRDRAGSELVKSVTRAVPARTELLVLSDYAEVDLPRVVREEQPDVVLTLGEPALKAVRKIRGIPVVAVMSLSLREKQNVPANITGIDIRIDPSRYMNIFKSLGLKRVGVEYDPARSGVYLAKAQHAAAQAGIELLLKPARNSQEVVKKLESLKGKSSDGLWLIPDPTAVTSLTLEASFTFSMEQNKPVISYTGEHLKKGAAVALNPDWSAMGIQTGGIVRRLLDGASPREIPLQSPQSFSLNRNESVLKHLGLSPAGLDKLK
jgi:putative tryptophan/tyrosine transport system substrate-binding protein